VTFKIQHLPNFLDVEPLNKLRRAMGAELIAPITNLQIKVLTLDEILGTTGQDVDINEVEFSEDSTFLFQGRRVILHIRDVQSYGHELTMPKYHLANCRTLQQMWERHRSERYVVSTRQDGVFQLKTSEDGGNSWIDREKVLDVCKNCLTTLNWDSYKNSSQNQRAAVFEDFKLKTFFNRYPGSPLTYAPMHSDVTAPINTYSSNFTEISKAHRESVKWVCDECKADLSEARFHKFLHVHHIDGMKNNNKQSNLKALCIECHSKQDHHNHLGNNPDLAAYKATKNNKSNGFRVL
jgi:hypothetical protein